MNGQDKRQKPMLAYGFMTARFHTLHNRVSPHNPLVPSTLARARRAYPSQARLGYAGADRSAPHLVLIGFQLAFPLSQARTPWTRRARLRSSKACVRAHDRSLPHLHNQAQTSNKAHDKFVPRRDCACADRSRPSLSTALLSGWSSHLA